VTIEKASVFTVAAAWFFTAVIFYMAFFFPKLDYASPQWQGHWIAVDDNPGARGYFRKIFNVNARIKNAWVRVAANNEYRLYVNGNIVAQNIHMRRNTSAFQEGYSESGQRVRPLCTSVVQPIIELFWERHKDYYFPVYVDITPYLINGRNAICLDVTTAEPHPSMILDGNLDFYNGTRTTLASNREWRANPTAVWEPGMPWTHAGFDDARWKKAKYLENPPDAGAMKLVVEPGGFEEPFHGRWLMGSMSHSLFYGTLSSDQKPEKCLLEILSVKDYLLMVNGQVVSPLTGSLLAHEEQIHMMDLTHLMVKGENKIQIALKEEAGFSEKTPSALRLAVGGTLTVNGRKRKLVEAFRWTSCRSFGLSEDADIQHISSQMQVPLDQKFRSLYRRVYCGNHLPLKKNFLWAGLGALAAALGAGAFAARMAEKAGPGHTHQILVKHGLIAFIALDILLFSLVIQESPLVTYVMEGSFWGAACVILGLLYLPLWVWDWCRTRVKGIFSSDGNRINIDATQKTRKKISHVKNFIYSTLLKKISKQNNIIKNIPIALILGLGFFLRIWKVWEQNLNADEASSISVALQILEHGFPFLYSGIIYVRSTLFHYCEALNIAVFGNNLMGMRMLSIIAGVCTIYLTYRFVLDIFKNRPAAVLAALLISISPWEILHSRIGRYYQMAQLLILLSVYLFYQGSVIKNKIKLQWAMVLVYAFSVISSEITATFLPALFSAYFLQWKSWRWKDHTHIFSGVFSLVVIMAFILIARNTATRTAPIMIPIMVEPVSPHIPPALSFPVFLFMGYSYFNFFISCAAIAGGFYWLYQEKKSVLMLYWLILISLGSIMSLIMPEAPRYVFYINPMLIIACSLFLCEIPAMVSRFLKSSPNAGFPCFFLKRLSIAAVVFHLLLILVMYQPWRILQVLKTGRINREEIRAVEFIKDHMQKEDIIVTTHVQTAAVALQKSPDYVLLPYFMFGTVFLRTQDGKMADRWNASEVITSIDKLRFIMDKYQRIWFIMSDMPGILPLDMRLYLDKTTHEVFNSFCAKVFLWEADKGKIGDYSRKQMEGNLF